jgi:hypothetical protein
MRKFLMVLSLLAMALVIVLSSTVGMAQDDTDTPDDVLIFIRGLVQTIDDDIVVDGVTVAPAGAFNPSELQIGAEVVVVGYLLNDDTILAVELILVDDNFDECGEYGNGEGCDPDPEITPEITPELTPEITPEPTPEITETPELAGCVPNSHPVANAIADEFGVAVAEVIALHCAGYGFGNIARAYVLVYDHNFGGDVESLLSQARDGGWGAVIRESGVHPSELATGRVINGRRGQQDTDDEIAETSATQRENNGNGNGNNGNGNGNNGNGNGNNGNGNGNNGNGNGNNGNGNGNNGNGNGNNGNGNGNNGNGNGNGNGRGNGRGG